MRADEEVYIVLMLLILLLLTKRCFKLLNVQVFFLCFCIR
uniref:Uncharacterized protein n=1 Tax=Anguilla anguilla TaxID=7936 RepID=A0A0E9XT36_ANGAN